MYGISLNIGDPLVLWIIRTILLLVLFYCGSCISNEGKNTNKNIRWVAIISYALVEGLRWMRGPDYYHYYQDLATNFSSPECTPDPELFYKIFVNTFCLFGLPPSVAFVLYSALLMYAFIKVIDHYKEVAIWALPLFYIITCAATENLIRQFIAVAFALLAFHYYLERKKIAMTLCFATIPFIHLTGMFVWALFYIFHKVKIKMTDKLCWLILGSYIVLNIIWDVSNLSSYLEWMQFINMGDSKFAHYAEDSELWFGKDASEKGLEQMSIISQYVGMLAACLVLYYGYRACQCNCKLYIPYWLTCVSLFLDVIGKGLELVARFSLWINVFVPIVLASGIFYLRNKYSEKRIMYTIIIVIYLGYYFLKSWGRQGTYGSAFIWDK